MKKTHFYCQGREVSPEEAAAIDRENEALLASPNKSDWLKIKVVTTLTEKEEPQNA